MPSAGRHRYDAFETDWAVRRQGGHLLKYGTKIEALIWKLMCDFAVSSRNHVTIMCWNGEENATGLVREMTGQGRYRMWRATN